MKQFKLAGAFFALLVACCVGVNIAFAGAVDGPTKQNETVEEGKTDVYRIRFKAGEKAVVRTKVRGDIDLFIYDSHDTLVVKDTDNAQPVCVWTPKTADEFKIKVVNNEGHSVDYKLETN